MHATISQFINQEIRVWDWGFDFSFLFSLVDLERIQCIPLKSFSYPDSLVWHFNSAGIYSGKSGYWMALCLGSNNLSTGTSSSIADTAVSSTFYRNWQSLRRLLILFRDHPLISFQQRNILHEQLSHVLLECMFYGQTESFLHLCCFCSLSNDVWDACVFGLWLAFLVGDFSNGGWGWEAFYLLMN